MYPHFHAVIPDGVFALDSDGKLAFHPLRPSDEELAKVVGRISRKAARLLKSLDLEAVVPDALDLVRAQAVQCELALKINLLDPAPRAPPRPLRRLLAPGRPTPP